MFIFEAFNVGLGTQEITCEINAALDVYFPESSGVRVIAEPGRYFAASAFHLAANVIARRRVPNSASSVAQTPAPSGEHFMYYINDGVYGSFNCMLYDHQVLRAEPLKPCRDVDAPLATSSVWGPTCDGLDVIHENILLPKLEIGLF